MTGLVSTISGQFSKSLILGSFLPAVVFMGLAVVLLFPLFPAEVPSLQRLGVFEAQWPVIAIGLSAVGLAGLLHNLNIPIIRLYEGYPWQYSALGRYFADQQRTRLRELRAREREFSDLLDKLPAGSEVADQVAARWNEAGRDLMTRFPKAEGPVLPTRLGNVLRSFEDYPDRQYGIASISLWPRLFSVIDKEYAMAIDDTKIAFDFMLNSSLLSVVLAVSLLCVGIIYPSRLASGSLLAWWVLGILISVLSAVLFYTRSIDRASAWGTLVKGAFDLYRWKLLAHMGYKQNPTTRAEERALWDRISRQVIYGDGPNGPRMDYLTEPDQTPYARADSPTLHLQVSRGVSAVDAQGVVRLRLQVRNADPRRRTAADIEVVDRPPDGFEYLWGSAWLAGGAVRQVGVNPCHFQLVGQELEYGAEIHLGYAVISSKFEHPYPAPSTPSLLETL